ncbi:MULTISPECIES: Rpn family recombination-promoting nuclease/putative transposase [unclassified Nodularia (in: cyanobacteria)]|uniref:Rpn family recombination-promoting nuclease/putative transposase n=1 Tax=unclassified Nodularia (in: cyanobacteria) TaxID=2656917 RepID=UPI0018830DC4|nr:MULTISPECIES: Rpn family recombination-promoting nuclease/putative transposase [unclassified Nodularia (in: cyanobacteria)]MBE9199686.1 Rpn family recombination-promoting nuclease/putative transposase [Nodularia sp. LEGE 06071]MCC2692204.1 Rpn family recombination-promoting nuclease/putative transposase [Nodularia sp. LEGE 04288]
MKTDAIFYEIFKEFPHIFFEIIGAPDTNTNTYEFSAPEIKQKSFRLDGLFSPLETFPNQPLYFVEIQFYKDEEFYDRLFTSIFLYFTQYQPLNPDWLAIVIYDKRSNERSYPLRYRSLLSPHLRRFYLDELEDLPNNSLGVGIVRLVVENENKAEELAKTLIEKAREELTDTLIQKKVIEFIETIVVYKFPNLSREEIESMLNLNLLKETRVYQEAKEEGEIKAKLNILPKLVQRGLSIQEIAELLELDTETIRKALGDNS